MDLDEMLALMAAPIYAARMQIAASRGLEREWNAQHAEAMQRSVTEARMIWDIARAEARTARVNRERE